MICIESTAWKVISFSSVFVLFCRVFWSEFPDHSDRLWEAKSDLRAFIQNLKVTCSPVSQNCSIIAFVANLHKVSANATAILDM